MGLAASQARYLALTSRKSDLEYQSQTINTRRLQLAYKTAEIARAYSKGMNNRCIAIERENGDVEALNLKNLKEEGFMIIGLGGSELQPAPYKLSSYSKKVPLTYSCGTSASITMKQSDYKALSASDKGLLRTPTGYSASAADTTEYTFTINTSNINATKYDSIKNADLKAAFSIYTYEAQTLTLDGKLTKQTYDKDGKPTGTSTTTSGNAVGSTSSMTSAGWNANFSENPNYSQDDLQAALVKGKAQVVSKAFYIFLCQNGYSYATGLSEDKFADLQQQWKNEGSDQGEWDWSADETGNFSQEYYTADDEAVLRRYEADTADVNRQDKALELEEKNIETQHKAIETEMENVKKVITKNIEETFKIFS